MDERIAAIGRTALALALDRALAEVMPAFRARGVEPLLLKGPAFARWLYDDLKDRAYRDIDLLVGPDEFSAAERSLAELGFVHRQTTPRPEGMHHEVWARQGARELKVEVHRRLAGMSAPLDLVWERMSAGAERISVRGVMVNAPSVPVGALIVALHAGHHGIVGCKHLTDLDRALRRVRLDEWQQAARLADELGADGLFVAGLLLTEDGTNLAHRLGLSQTVSRGARLRMSGPPETALGIELLASASGTRSRLRLIAQGLSPSPAFMRYRYPVARRGRRGLLMAYLLRPAWVAVRLPRGARAWLAATRHDLVVRADGAPRAGTLPTHPRRATIAARSPTDGPSRASRSVGSSDAVSATEARPAPLLAAGEEAM